MALIHGRASFFFYRWVWKSRRFPGITASIDSRAWIWWCPGEGPQGCTQGAEHKQLCKLSKQEKGGRQSDLQAVNHNLLFDIMCLLVRYCSILRAEQEQRRWKLHQRGTHCHGLSWLRLNDLKYTIQITAKCCSLRSPELLCLAFPVSREQFNKCCWNTQPGQGWRSCESSRAQQCPTAALCWALKPWAMKIAWHKEYRNLQQVYRLFSSFGTYLHFKFVGTSVLCVCSYPPAHCAARAVCAAAGPIDSFASSQNSDSKEYPILCNKVCMKFLPATIPQCAELHDTDLNNTSF